MRTCSSYIKIIVIVLGVAALPFQGIAQQPTASTFFDIGLDNYNKMEYSEAIDSFEHAIKLSE